MNGRVSVSVNIGFRSAVIIVLITLVFVVLLGVYFYDRTLPSTPVSEGREVLVSDIIYNTSRILQGASTKALIVSGLVKNNQQAWLNSLRVNATFYDAEDRVINETFGGSFVTIVGPGQIAPFEIYFPLGSSGTIPSRYALSASALVDTETHSADVEILSSVPSLEDGYHVIRGSLKNTGEMKAVYVKVYGLYYNAEGKVSYVSESLVADWINPGYTMPFEVSSKPNKIEFADFEVVVVVRTYDWYYFWRYGSPQLWLFVIVVVIFVLFIVYMKRRGW